MKYIFKLAAFIALLSIVALLPSLAAGQETDSGDIVELRAKFHKWEEKTRTLSQQYKVLSDDPNSSNDEIESVTKNIGIAAHNSFVFRLQLQEARIKKSVLALAEVQERLWEREANADEIISNRVQQLLASQHLDSNFDLNGSQSEKIPKQPVYLGRDVDTGMRQLNPEWVRPLRQMLAKATAIEVIDDNQNRVRVSLGELPGKGGSGNRNAGQSRASLVGGIVVVVGDGEIRLDKDGPTLLCTVTNSESMALATELLPLLVKKWSGVEPVPAASAASAVVKLEPYSPMALRKQASDTRELALRNLLSGHVSLYASAKQFFEWSFSFEKEAEQRELAIRSKERSQKATNEVEKQRLLTVSRNHIALAMQISAIRDEKRRLSQQEDRNREKAQQLSLQIAALHSEGNVEDAETLKLELDRFLRENDRDTRLVAEWESRAATARLDGRHEHAERCHDEAAKLRNRLDRRYHVDQNGQRITND